VIIEDRIRERIAGRNSRAVFCPAANEAAQFPASKGVSLPGIERKPTVRRASASRTSRPARGICSALSNRELTMRRASASRASAPRRATRGICSTFSNRELKLLEPSLTHRKQKTTLCSNRELSTNVWVNDAQVHSPSLPQICKWSRPLLIDSAPQTKFDVTYRKQTTEKFLTGARTHIRETRFAQHFHASPLGFPK
jgi:hypothetical protein